MATGLFHKKIRITYSFCVLFLALAMGTTFAHVLEFPQKMKLNPQLYAAINSSLYKFFAIIGGTFCVAAIALNFLLWLLVWHKKVRVTTFLYSLFFQLGWLISWLLIVAPVNRRISRISFEQSIHLWRELAIRWESGHIIGFLFHFMALCCLLFYIPLSKQGSGDPGIDF